MAQRDDLLCWIDLEMTGLDPGQNTIVEIATILTDGALEIVAEGPEIVIHAGEEHIGRMIPIVRDMHAKSGLTEKVRLSNTNLADAELETLAFLKEHLKERSAPLCGNSIWCDRMFLKLQMPRIDAWLHYRTIDVSSFKECATRWNVNAIGGAPKKGDKHRALDDIRESIAELKHYKEKWLAPPKPPKEKPKSRAKSGAGSDGDGGAAT
ncbi:MAG: oligoribonuclease [Planctomycetes bacterium]|nr:oligoribonuclease [Planctomycetota bacterium]